MAVEWSLYLPIFPDQFLTRWMRGCLKAELLNYFILGIVTSGRHTNAGGPQEGER
jgi:hypothetical protein